MWKFQYRIDMGCKDEIEGEGIHKLWVKVTIHIELEVRPLSDSSLTADQKTET
jgi:hypothetical protein